MAVNLLLIILTGIVLIGVYIGGTILQVRLSKKESVWQGLILPIISFVLSIMIIAMIYLAGAGSQGASGGQIFGVFLFLNVPTLFLMIIYVMIKIGKKRKAD